MSSKATREDVSVLCTILYVKERSTAYNELYLASSDSTIGKVLEVRYNVARDRWYCEEARCDGFRFRGWCHHCERARRLRAVQFFHALYLGYGPAELRTLHDHHQGRLDEGWGDEQDRCALDALLLLRQYTDREVA